MTSQIRVTSEGIRNRRQPSSRGIIKSWGPALPRTIGDVSSDTESRTRRSSCVVTLGAVKLEAGRKDFKAGGRTAHRRHHVRGCGEARSFP